VLWYVVKFSIPWTGDHAYTIEIL